MFVYGIWIALLCLSSFVFVLYRIGDGNLGDGCNEGYSEICDVPFRARATAFTCLTWFSLFLAWQLIDLRQSFFMLRRGNLRYLWQVLYANKFLFFSVVLGFVLIFPVLYIPGLNKVVFKHRGISTEWVVVAVATVLFFTGVEAWKWAKRAYFRRSVAKEGPDDDARRSTTVSSSSEKTMV